MIEILVKFPQDADYSSYSHLLRDRSLQVDEQIMSKKRKSCVDSAFFNLKHSDAFLAKLVASSGEVPVLIKISDETGDLFAGKIATNFEQDIHQVKGPLMVEAIDNSYLLDEKISSSFQYPDSVGDPGYKIFDQVNQAGSIVHRVLVQAGYALDDIEAGLSDIDISVLHVAATEGDETYREFLDELLFEYGYCFYFNASGKFCLYKWLEEDPVTSYTLTNQFAVSSKKFSYKKTENYHDGFKVQYTGAEVIQDARLYDARLPIDNTGAFTGENIFAGLYYPEEAEFIDVFQTFQQNWLDVPYLSFQTREKNRDLTFIASSGQYVSFDADPEISMDTEEYEPHRARIRFHNAAAEVKRIYYFAIYGDALIRKNLFESISPADCANPDEYTSRFLFDSSYADLLSQALSTGGLYGEYEYRWSSRDILSPGERIHIAPEGTQIDTDVLILSRKRIVGSSLYDYVALAISPFNQYVKSVVYEKQSNAITAEDLPGNLPSWEAIEEGWNSLNSTMTPTDVLLQAKGSFKSVILRWDRQDNLSNLLEYHIQVSDNQVDWYALGFDGSDFKGGLAESYTIWPAEFLVHTPIPFTGTEEEPAGVLLYYRIRRVTKKLVVSDWTATISNTSATTETVRTQDIPANSIAANKLETTALEAMFANVQNELVVGKDYGNGAPLAGSRRLVIKENRFVMQSFDGELWLEDIALGGFATTGNFLPYMAARGIMSPDADLPPIGGETPNPYCLYWRFEGTLLPHNGEDVLYWEEGEYDAGLYDQGFQGSFFTDFNLYAQTVDFSFYFNKIANTAIFEQYISHGARIAGPTVNSNGFGSYDSLDIAQYYGYRNVNISDSQITLEILTTGAQSMIITYFWVSFTIFLTEDEEGPVESNLTKVVQRKRVSSMQFGSMVGSWYSSNPGGGSFDPIYVSSDPGPSGASGTTKITLERITQTTYHLQMRAVQEVPIHVFVKSFDLVKSAAAQFTHNIYNSDGSLTSSVLASASSGMLVLKGDGTYHDVYSITGAEEDPDEAALTNKAFGNGVKAFPSGISGTWVDFGHIGISKINLSDAGDYIDELVYNPLGSDYQVYLNHYKMGLQWNPYYRDGDIVMAPAPGRSVVVYGKLINDTVTIVGPKGDQGDQGIQGDQGYNSYDLWLAAGNVGTIEDFFRSLDNGIVINGGTWDTVYNSADDIDGGGW